MCATFLEIVKMVSTMIRFGMASYHSVREVLGSILWSVKSDTVVNGSPPLRRFCAAWTLSRRDGPATRFTLRQNAAS